MRSSIRSPSATRPPKRVPGRHARANRSMITSTGSAGRIMGHIAAGRLLLPELIELPGGLFLMGNDHGRPDEQPRHRVQLDAFRAAISPVTNAQFGCYVAAEGAPDPPFSGEDRFSSPEQPVVGISWHDAVAFCSWLTAQTGTHWRLPTEAEREFAALGGLDAGDWPW